MTTRRRIMAAALSSAFLSNVASAQAQTPEKQMSNKNEPRGPANHGLAALERTWVAMRFNLDAMMEEGRVQRDLWEKAKLNAIHGYFDIRDPDNGDLLLKVEKGVRLPPPSSSPSRPSGVH
jgi:hypothetical protein